MKLIDSYHDYDFTDDVYIKWHDLRKKEGEWYDPDYLTCDLYLCHLGIVYNCPGMKDYCSDPHDIVNFFYIGFVRSNKFNNMILKLIPTSKTNKYIYSVVVCPNRGWINGVAHSDFHHDYTNYITKITVRSPIRTYVLKFVYCHQNNGKDTFVSCGTLNQDFLPKIDVGYECDDYNNWRANKIINDNEKEIDMTFMSDNKLICNGVDIYSSDPKVVAIFESGNIYNPDGDSYRGNLVHGKMNLYPGQKLHAIDREYIYNEIQNNRVDIYLGFAFMYQAKCKVPYLNATLRLKIDGKVQTVNKHMVQNIHELDNYVFERTGKKNIPVGCDVVLEKEKHPSLTDFYKKCCNPSLVIPNDENKFIQVFGIMYLEPNRKYVCTMSNGDSVNNGYWRPKQITDTKFNVKLIDKIHEDLSDSNNSTDSNDFNNFIDFNGFDNTSDYIIWIIFGVFIVVSVISIVGLIILKKIQLKKKKSNNSSSTSSSKSTIKSSTVISKVSNVPIIQKKNAFKTYTNMAKTMVTKNLDMNNKVTNFGQKVVGKNSNLINQIQNGTKNVVAKNSNLNLTNQTQNATKNVVAKNSNLNLANQTQNATKNVIAKNPNINLVNQVKNTPKKIAVKNTNQKKISNVGDSVFKLK
uniref:Glycoprotein n=1 Tax=Strongyloides papillosus TaxID=174720 RepID=A0A0N5BE28_STREA